MKRCILAAKELSEGIFWIVDDKLLAFPFGSVDSSNGVAKSGNTYNHKRLWNDLRPNNNKHPYNYYPRGRVVIDNQGRPVIYMNPNVDDIFIREIRQEFGILGEPKIIIDNSDHYKCYLDDGWVPDKSR